LNHDLPKKGITSVNAVAHWERGVAALDNTFIDTD